MKNTVTAGDYKGGNVVQDGSKVYVLKPQNPLISFLKGFLIICTIGICLFFMKSRKVFIDKKQVESYEVLGEEIQTSAASAVARGAIGALILGPVGLAVAASAKKKGIHTVAVQFKDGKKSLMDVDDSIFKAIVQNLF